MKGVPLVDALKVAADKAGLGGRRLSISRTSHATVRLDDGSDLDLAASGLSLVRVESGGAAAVAVVPDGEMPTAAQMEALCRELAAFLKA